MYDGRAVSFAFYPQGELLMTGDGIGTATAFRTSTGERRTQIPYPPAKDFMSATERVGGMEVAFRRVASALSLEARRARSGCTTFSA